MARIIIIGTLHAGLTPNSELEELLEKYKPDKLLVEITKDDLSRGNISSYPPEMQFAYGWGKSRGVKVDGFDSPIDTMAEGMREEDNLDAIERQKQVMKQYTWKDMNRPEVLQELERVTEGLGDSRKELERDKEMLRNIKRLVEPGTVVVVTGCGHLDYFQKHLPKAEFPLR